MAVTKMVTNELYRNCDGCGKAIKLGDKAIKHHRKRPLVNQWYHTKCWGNKGETK